MYKTSRGIGVSTLDAEIAAAISSAESWIESLTGRSLLSAEYTEYHSSPQFGNGWIQLDNWPVTAIASVSYWNGEWVALSSDQYEQRSSNGKVFFPSNTWGYFDDSRVTLGPAATMPRPPEADSLRVVYTAGYAANSLEKGLLEPFYRLVDAIRYDRTTPKLAQSDGFAGTMAVNRSAADTEMILNLLARPFRRTLL
jgi:hypothetical protein